MKDIRILLVDDRELVHCGVRGMLEGEEDMEIVGDCSSADEALFLTEIVSPNIILMDTKIPGIGGIEATRRLRQKQTPCNVIMLTLYEDCLAEALEAGVASYLLEDIKSQELAQAIRTVYHGELVIDERLTSTSQAREGESEYLPSEGNSMVREVDLVIPPPVDVAQLLRFIYQVEEALAATIVQQVGCWDKGTAITVVLRSVTPLAAILDRLEKMPEVEGVREKPTAKYTLFSFVKKTTARAETQPRKELLVTLKQTSPAKQLELAGHRIS